MPPGGKPKLSPEQWAEVIRRYVEEPGHSAETLARLYCLSASGVRKQLRAAGVLRNREAAGRHRAAPIAYKVTPTGCWLCTSHPCNGQGYPIRTWREGGRQHSALVYRVVYAKTHGDLPPRGRLRRICEDRRCINPDHWKPR